nr:MAG TPA: hypothetical protein [Microviridae sp.]
MAIDMGLATIIGAGLSAGAAGASAISSGKMNRRAEKYNKWALQQQQAFNAQQAQLGRDWSEEMMGQQNEWNLQQWQRENEYNTPAAQRARLEAAGLNAALMMQGQGSIGMAGSGQPAASPSGNPQASSGLSSAPQYVRPDFSLLSQAVDSFFKNKLISEQSTGQGLDNLLKARYGDELAQISIGKGSAEISNLRSQSARNYAETAVASLSAEAQRTLNKYLDLGQQLSLITKMAEYSSITAGTELTKAKYRTEIANEIKVLAEANGQKISNQVARSTAASLIDAMNKENEYRSYDAALGYDYLPRKHYLKNKGLGYDIERLEGDLGLQRVERALAEFEEYTRDTPGNRWLRKNVDPVTGIIGNLLGLTAAGSSLKYLRRK